MRWKDEKSSIEYTKKVKFLLLNLFLIMLKLNKRKMGTERTSKKERSKIKLKTNKQWTPLSCFEGGGGSDRN